MQLRLGEVGLRREVCGMRIVSAGDFGHDGAREGGISPGIRQPFGGGMGVDRISHEPVRTVSRRQVSARLPSRFPGAPQEL